MNRRANPALVGGFVLVGVTLIIAAVVIAGSGRAFRDTQQFVSYFPGSVGGLRVGSTVSFRGVPVGSVREILLALGEVDTDEVGADLRIPVIYEIDEELIRQRGTSFDLDQPEVLQSLLAQGLSARLDTESLVTGRLYVALDFRPDAELLTQDDQFELPEIPTVRSPMSEIGAQLNALADRFVQIDLEAVATALRTTLDGINSLVTNEETQAIPASVVGGISDLQTTLTEIQGLIATVDGSIAPTRESVADLTQRAETSMDSFDETMLAARTLLDPEAPLAVGMVETLRELESTAAALRRLVELIERDPTVLVRGRAPSEGN